MFELLIGFWAVSRAAVTVKVIVRAPMAVQLVGRLH